MIHVRFFDELSSVIISVRTVIIIVILIFNNNHNYIFHIVTGRISPQHLTLSKVYVLLSIHLYGVFRFDKSLSFLFPNS